MIRFRIARVSRTLCDIKNFGNRNVGIIKGYASIRRRIASAASMSSGRLALKNGS